MELILWRHADAEDGAPDLERRLTGKGHKQAKRVAEWLRKRLPEKYLLVSSPATRARETAGALEESFETFKELAPGASVEQILAAAGWPDRRKTVVLVGHQPDLGNAIAYLVSGAEADWSVKKGGLWWLEGRERGMLVRAVIDPDLL
jgi:phosphohistidine phosphatase